MPILSQETLEQLAKLNSKKKSTIDKIINRIFEFVKAIAHPKQTFIKWQQYRILVEQKKLEKYVHDKVLFSLPNITQAPNVRASYLSLDNKRKEEKFYYEMEQWVKEMHQLYGKDIELNKIARAEMDRNCKEFNIPEDLLTHPPARPQFFIKKRNTKTIT